MTALVGILNVRGAAIAADSAVTMTRDRNRKIANSANKMLRLSSAQPVSVMICGSGCSSEHPGISSSDNTGRKGGKCRCPQCKHVWMISFRIWFLKKSSFPIPMKKNSCSIHSTRFFK